MLVGFDTNLLTSSNVGFKSDRSNGPTCISAHVLSVNHEIFIGANNDSNVI
jgi:hypothetical protein